ncbi:hypothetical protein NQZ68_030851 [Dissostichus eleginoides]|nr:hypothetical protein NQZ68_030851 [Dissostichus eleginoides]
MSTISEKQSLAVNILDTNRPGGGCTSLCADTADLNRLNISIMSQAVDRNKVFKTTRMRTSLKNDECWIQRAKQEKKEEELASTDQAVESRPSPARLSSYVLSTVKRFEEPY